MYVAEIIATEESAEQWFVKMRWPDGVECPVCESHNIQVRTTRKPQPFRCRDCRKDFSVRTHSIMHGSKLSYRVWWLAIYQLTTNLKGVSSLKLPQGPRHLPEDSVASWPPHPPCVGGRRRRWQGPVPRSG